MGAKNRSRKPEGTGAFSPGVGCGLRTGVVATEALQGGAFLAAASFSG